MEIPHLVPSDIRALANPFRLHQQMPVPAELTEDEVEEQAVEQQQADSDSAGQENEYLEKAKENIKAANQAEIKKATVNNKSIQFFSFKNANEATFKTEGSDYLTNNNQLGFLPDSFRRAFKKDISRKILFDDAHIKKGDGTSTSQLTIDTILNNLPAVQIREFQPDLKLDQMITALNVIIKKIQSFTKDKSFSEIANKMSDAFKGIVSELTEADFNTYKYFFKYLSMYLVNIKSDDNKFEESFVDDLFSSEFTDKFDKTYHVENRDFDAMLLKIPYTIYYGLQSTTTNNIYEVPFINESKSFYSSNGAAGWQGSNTGFTASLVNAAKSIIGSIIPNIGISFSPWWDSTSGQSTYDDDAVVNFDLFNDNEAHAINNFTFINTIIPNNKWIQYGIIQQSPCLYDVRIEGIKRMYACTGEFKVTYSGKLRIPTYNFITNSLKKSSTIIADLVDQAESKNIKIPDVYHVQMTFKSLMPSNMNQFLFNFFGNKVIKKIRDNGALEKLLEGVSNVGSSIETLWNRAKGTDSDGNFIYGSNGDAG